MKAINIPARQPVPFATNGTKFAIPATQPAGSPGRASYDTGFPDETREPIAAGGTPPFGQDFNGLFFDVTNELRWAQAGGTYTYDSAFSASIGGYPAGAVLKSTLASALWISTVDDNTTDPDGGSAAGWVAFRPNSGRANLAVVSGDLTPTAAQKLSQVLSVTGNATGLTTTLRLPLAAGTSYLINNATTGSGATLNVQGATGTGVAVGQGQATVVFTDGTNYYAAGASGGPYLPASGTAVAATKLATARAFNLSGVITAEAVNFDGTGNVTLATAIADNALTIAKTSGLQTALDGKLSTGGGSLSGSLTLSAGSIFVSAGNVVASNMTAGSYNSPGVNWIAGTTGAGNMYFRPNGIGSSTGQMSLSNAGNLSLAGDIACLGASFGSNIASSATDLSQHIDLYGGIVGLSVTAGHLNYVVNSTSNHNWYTGTTNPMTLDVNGLLTVQSVKTVGALTSSGNIFLDSGAINDRYVYVYTNGVARWRFGGTGGGEGGGNTGTDWALTSFNDAGGFLASAMMVTRATSAVTFAGTGNFQGSDVRLKKNIQKSVARPLHRALTLCNYELISNGAKARGILAQDLQRAGPEYVSEADIGGTPDKPLKRLTVNYQGTALEIAIWAAQEVDSINARARLERWVLGGAALAFGLIALAARVL